MWPRSWPPSIVGAVQRQTEEFLHQWWADRFGIDRTAVWASVTARPHGSLGDYPGFFVAWRDAGVHVSVPGGADPGAVEETLAAPAIGDLQRPAFWHDFARRRGLGVIGPSSHLYLDADPGDDTGTVTPTEDELESLRNRVGDDDWREAGFADAPPLAFGLREAGVLVAAANLNLFDGMPRNVGVLVAPEARGRGLAATVARAATSYAVREHDVAWWGARDSNVASLATARRLGFERFCAQLAVR